MIAKFFAVGSLEKKNRNIEEYNLRCGLNIVFGHEWGKQNTFIIIVIQVLEIKRVDFCWY